MRLDCISPFSELRIPSAVVGTAAKGLPLAGT
jgi:hypothetical protein